MGRCPELTPNSHNQRYKESMTDRKETLYIDIKDLRVYRSMQVPEVDLVVRLLL